MGCVSSTRPSLLLLLYSTHDFDLVISLKLPFAIGLFKTLRDVINKVRHGLKVALLKHARVVVATR